MRALHRLLVCGTLAVLAPACTRSCAGAGAGEPCASEGDCRGELACIANESGTRQCMARCAAGEWLCADGAVCLESPSDGPVCWFGGSTSYAAPCAAPLECEPGTVCERGLCLQACMVGPPVDAGVTVDADVTVDAAALDAGSVDAGGMDAAALDAGTVVDAGTNPVCEPDERCLPVVAGSNDGVCVPPDPEDVDGGV